MATGVFLFLPSTVDLEELSSVKKLCEIEGFSLDHLAYMLQLPRYLPSVSESAVTEKGYTKISSRIAQRFVRNYNNYLDALCQIGILISDRQFILGHKSFGYKFEEPHDTSEIAKYEITNPDFAKKLVQFNLLPRGISADYHHLTKWFNNNLRIDETSSKAFLTEHQNIVRQEAFHKFFNENNSTSRVDKIASKVAFLKAFGPVRDYIYGVFRVNLGQYSLSVDQTSGRFHSNLTNLKSELRHALTYDGKQLVSIDIKNSQPFMSLALLNSEFYLSYGRIIVPEEFLQMLARLKSSATASGELVSESQGKSVQPSAITIEGMNADIASRALGREASISNYTALITLVKDNKLTNSTDILLYRELVLSGRLYEHLENLIVERGSPKPRDRSALKAVVFQVLFTANSFVSEEKKLFKDAFPTVNKLFSLLKTLKKNDLPILLQTIESHLFVEVITRRIASEHPEIPIFTVHDSIITTVGNEEYVQRVMTEEIQAVIGATPTYGIEYYTIKTLNRITARLRRRITLMSAIAQS